MHVGSLEESAPAGGGFSAADFCTSALPGAEEPKQMDRGACKQGVAQAP